LFTIGELREEIRHHPPGAKIIVRYRRYSTISEASPLGGQCADKPVRLAVIHPR
jgi:hypothetical protein